MDSPNGFVKTSLMLAVSGLPFATTNIANNLIMLYNLSDIKENFL